MKIPPMRTIMLCRLNVLLIILCQLTCKIGSWKYWITLTSTNNRIMRRSIAIPIPHLLTIACLSMGARLDSKDMYSKLSNPKTA